MGRKKEMSLSTREKLSLTQKAKQTERLGDLAKMVDANLATKPNECWRSMTREHKEVVLYRLQAGDTVKHVCDQLGISPGVVYMARHYDDQFKEDYHKARIAGAEALTDAIRDIHLDATLSDARAKIASDNYKWLAARLNRDEFGDHMKVDQNVTVQPINMPQWSFGPIIEGQVIKGDPDAEE